jgi:hypothetical protein
MPTTAEAASTLQDALASLPLSWADQWSADNGGKEPPLGLLMDMLRQPHDPRDVESIQGQGTFINVQVIRERIDQRIGAGRWDWTIDWVSCLSGAPYIGMVGRLTVKGADGQVTKAGCGDEPLWEHQPRPNGMDQKTGMQLWKKPKAYGSPVKNAEASALRRAVMAHGFHRALWDSKGMF